MSGFVPGGVRVGVRTWWSACWGSYLAEFVVEFMHDVEQRIYGSEVKNERCLQCHHRSHRVCLYLPYDELGLDC